IVGGTVGGVVFLLLLAGLFWWWRRRKSTSDSEAADVEGPRETGEDRHVSRHKGIFWRHSPPRKGHHRASLETSEIPEIAVGEEDERPRSPRGFNVWRVGESPR